MSCPGNAAPQPTMRIGGRAVERRNGHRFAAEPRRVDTVDHHAVARERDGQRVLGQAVARHEARRAKARRLEPVGEGLQRVGTNRFSAATGDAPAREVERLDLRRLHPPQAELVGKVRRERDRAAVLRDRLEPRRRPLEKEHRRHDDRIGSRAHGGHQHADEAHVVVERQPAHADVGGRRRQCRRDRRWRRRW